MCVPLVVLLCSGSFVQRLFCVAAVCCRLPLFLLCLCRLHVAQLLPRSVTSLSTHGSQVEPELKLKKAISFKLVVCSPLSLLPHLPLYSSFSSTSSSFPLSFPLYREAEDTTLLGGRYLTAVVTVSATPLEPTLPPSSHWLDAAIYYLIALLSLNYITNFIIIVVTVSNCHFLCLSELHNDSGDNSKGNSQKKQKYVTLTSTEGQNRMTMCFPGRHTCECLAQKHPLVNNCTECGRIVCEQVCGIKDKR